MGVPAVDAQVASYLLSAGCSCEVALVGVRSRVAETIVRLNVGWSEVITRATPQVGITWVLKRRGLDVSSSDIDW